jgi:bifunctional non-homologous end joining protein LigD
MTLWHERPIRPMMAKTGYPFDSDNHFFEIKWDGLRALMFLQNGKLELQNRNLRDVTASYPEIQNVAKKIRAKKAIIDGEVVVLSKKGTPDFGKLQNRFGIEDPKRVETARSAYPVTYVAFDLLHLNGKDVIKNQLEIRKKALHELIEEGPHLLYGDHVQREGLQYYSEALKLGFEGTVGKEKHSPYLLGTRSSFWIKSKGSRTLDAIVVGYIQGEGMRKATFGSLVMAMYDDQGKLVHVGNVGGGFDDKTLLKLKPMLEKLVVKKPIIPGPVEAPSPITWVKPRIVCEVIYANITTDKKLRFPRFNRLRTDKKPEECVLDEDILSGSSVTL